MGSASAAALVASCVTVLAQPITVQEWRFDDPAGMPPSEAAVSVPGGPVFGADGNGQLTTGGGVLRIQRRDVPPNSIAEIGLTGGEQWYPIPDYRDYIWDITYPLVEDTGTYVQGWHDCRDGCTRAHRAVDIYASPGTPVYAAAAGRIRWRRTSAAADWSPTSGSGYALYIDEPDGFFRHFYGHFGPDEPGREEEAFAVNPATGELWQVGDWVESGQLLGYVGTSGATASGPHLHFELRSLVRGLPEDDPGDDAIEGRSYGNIDAAIGSFTFPRWDPFPSFQAAEARGDYPEPAPLGVGDHVMVYGVTSALNVRGPGPCDPPISGAGQQKGRVGRIVGGPVDCPEITSFPMWQILWEDCTLGWSSERFLHGTVGPAGFCEAYAIDVSVSGDGDVTLVPDQPVYAAGSTLEIHAAAYPEWDFLHWSGGKSGGENPLVLTVEEDLVLTAVFGRTYEAWIRARFTDEERSIEGLTAPENDPFGVGLSNLTAYAFGINPRDPDRTGLPRVERDGDAIVFYFRRLKDDSDLEYFVDVSEDLRTWTPLDPDAGGWQITGEPGRPFEVVRVPPGTDGGAGFVRVRIEL